MALQTAQKQAVTTQFKFLEKGDTLSGYYQGKVEKTINGSPAIEHTYKTKEGIVSVLGQANILSQIKNNGIKVGAWMDITFTGEMQRLKNGRTMKVYDILFDNENLDDNVVDPTDMVADDYTDETDDVTSAAPTRATRPTTPLKAPDAAARAKAMAALAGRKVG